jgi:hypothetical protein
MSLPSFKLFRPRTLREAVDYLARHGNDLMVLAGGTDLLPSMKQKLFTPAYLMDIRGIDEIRGIHVRPGAGMEIGALTPLSAIEDSEFIRRNYRVLHEAAMTVASPILRNMGTLGGNICLDTRCVWYNQSRKTATCATLRREESSAGRPFPAIRRRRCSALAQNWRLPGQPGCGASRLRTFIPRPAMRG